MSKSRDNLSCACDERNLTGEILSHPMAAAILVAPSSSFCQETSRGIPEAMVESASSFTNGGRWSQKEEERG